MCILPRCYSCQAWCSNVKLPLTCSTVLPPDRPLPQSMGDQIIISIPIHRGPALCLPTVPSHGAVRYPVRPSVCRSRCPPPPPRRPHPGLPALAPFPRSFARKLLRNATLLQVTTVSSRPIQPGQTKANPALLVLTRSAWRTHTNRHHTTPHYTTLHHTTLRCAALHCAALLCTTQPTTPSNSTLESLPLLRPPARLVHLSAISLSLHLASPVSSPTRARLAFPLRPPSSTRPSRRPGRVTATPTRMLRIARPFLCAPVRVRRRCQSHPNRSTVPVPL